MRKVLVNAKDLLWAIDRGHLDNIFLKPETESAFIKSLRVAVFLAENSSD
jgi:hypothetical protein